MVAWQASTACATRIASGRGSTGSSSTAVAIDCDVAAPFVSSPWIPSIDPAGADPFRDLIERDALLAGLTRLTPDERIVIVLRYWADLPLEGDRGSTRMAVGERQVASPSGARRECASGTRLNGTWRAADERQLERQLRERLQRADLPRRAA